MKHEIEFGSFDRMIKEVMRLNHFQFFDELAKALELPMTSFLILHQKKNKKTMKRKLKEAAEKGNLIVDDPNEEKKPKKAAIKELDVVTTEMMKESFINYLARNELEKSEELQKAWEKAFTLGLETGRRKF
jgi:hypothetical protein